MSPLTTRSSEADLVPTRLMRHAQTQPNRTILAFLDEAGSIQRSWTFRELDLRARSIAAHLLDRGLDGQTTALAYPAGLEFISAFCGCLYAGAVAVPTSLPRAHGADERLSTVVADSGAQTVLTCGAHRNLVGEQLAGNGAAVEILATDALRYREDWSPQEWTGSQLAFLQYTSGSTRSPRGVMISHANLAANLESLSEMLRTHQDPVGVSWLPLFHDMGLIAGVLEPLWVGYPTYLMAPATFLQNPLRWLRAFSRYRGTIGGGPNFAYQACVDTARSSGISDLDLSSWELAWNGAEPIRPKTLDCFRDTFAKVGFRANSLTPSFGLAEATLLVTINNSSTPPYELVVDEVDLRNRRIRPSTPESRQAKRLVGSGTPGRGIEVRIVEPENCREATPGSVGEIWVRSASVGQGYWRKPAETVITFKAYLDTGEGPFLRTGDLGFLHDGELFVTGRLKDVIVIRGANYYPHDLEYTVEASHPALRADAGIVVGLEDGGSVRLVAVQEVRRDCWQSVRGDEVREAIRRALAREHQVAVGGVVLLKPFGLPKTSSGKVQRSRCREALSDRSLPAIYQWWAPVGQIAPIEFTGESLAQPGVLERQLVNWLRRELALENLGWKTPLTELGIDSLKAVELGNALAAAFNRPFPATLIIDHPTIETLAGMIRREVLGFAEQHTLIARSEQATIAERVSTLTQEEVEAALEQRMHEVLRRSAGRA